MPTLANQVDRGREKRGHLKVTVLPDFFLDHFVKIDDYGGFRAEGDAIHARGGGNLLTGAQSFRVGGNAANTVYALGRLGVKTTLITRTDKIGALALHAAFEGLPVDTSCIEVGAETSATVALESRDANVMWSYPGPLATFGPGDLEAIPGAWGQIDKADAVVITNWSQTLQHGTHLLEGVASRARENGAFTFLDTGDPTHRGSAAGRLLERDGPLAHVSAWGMNENELRFFAGLANRTGEAGRTDTAGSGTTGVEHGTEHGSDPGSERDAGSMELFDAARTLASVFKGRLDVHTMGEVFSLENRDVVRCGTYRVEPLRLTGSGDAWNAGNLLGELLGVSAEDRLRLANAVAALTITAEDGLPPTFDALVSFLRKQPFAERGPMD